VPKPAEQPAASGIELIEKMVDDAARAQAARQGGSSSEARPTPDADAPHTYYVYRDDAGVEHIVDALELVPVRHRGKAKKWVMAGEEQLARGAMSEIGSALTGAVRTVSAPVRAPGHEALHLPSFLAGLAAAAAVFLGAVALRSRARRLAKVALVLVSIALLGGAYLGWMRRQTGLGAEMVTSPHVMVDSARDAAERLQRRMQEEQRLLEQIDAQIATEAAKGRPGRLR
jgi:hypothetical protein